MRYSKSMSLHSFNKFLMVSIKYFLSIATPQLEHLFVLQQYITIIFPKFQ